MTFKDSKETVIAKCYNFFFISELHIDWKLCFTKKYDILNLSLKTVRRCVLYLQNRNYFGGKFDPDNQQANQHLLRRLLCPKRVPIKELRERPSRIFFSHERGK